MKKLLLILSLVFLAGCVEKDVDLAQTPMSANTPAANQTLNENITSNQTSNSHNKANSQNSSDSAFVTENPSPRKNPSWKPGTFIGLQLGQSTVEDVLRLFGKPKMIIHPEDGEDNPIESRLDYIYDDKPQIIVDKKTGIVIAIWWSDFATFREAVEKYGSDFYTVEFKNNSCIFGEYKKDKKTDYPLYLAYPQYGFYFAINERNEIVNITYAAKCGDAY